MTVKEQKEWKIPPCISNWKNAKGYTIPLDKRLAADGRGLQQNHLNENFAKLSDALYIADRKAREAVEARAQLEKKLAQKEKEKKEDHLRLLAQKAREERAGIKSAANLDKSEETREREKLRQERHKDRARERNLARAAPDKRSRLQQERERDISEQIALGMPAKNIISGEAQFDQRLFNTSKGLDSGFGHEDDYNVYDKPWRENAMGSQIYRPGKNIDKDNYGDDMDKIMNTNRLESLPDFISCLIKREQMCSFRVCLIYLFIFVSGLYLTRNSVAQTDLILDKVLYNLRKKRRKIRSVWISS